MGTDLSPLLLGEQPATRYDTPQYFMTDDEPTRGTDQVSFNGTMFKAVAQPSHIETVIARLPTGPDGILEQWKYSRYFDNPEFWSTPGKKDVSIFIDGKVADEGPHNATTTTRSRPVREEIEVYNVSTDPTELENLAQGPGHAATIAILAGLLIEQRRKKRLEPIFQARFPLLPGGIGA